VVRLATKKDTPDDDGTAGPRDAVVRPLVHIMDGDGVPRGCPLLELDRLRGDDAGARWVFAPSDATLDASVIRATALTRSCSPSAGATPTCRVSRSARRRATTSSGTW